MNRLVRFPIKGTYYYAAELALDLSLIQTGTELIFKTEPDNAYDRYAIQIWLPTPTQSHPVSEHGYLLGYVPKVMSKKLHAALQAKPSRSLSVVHIAQRGKQIEIDCLLSIQQSLLPYLYLSVLSTFASKVHRLKRLTQRWLN